MWKQVIEHFQTLEERPLERTSFLVGGLLLFWIIEGAIPLLPMRYKNGKVRHAGVNLVFTIIHLIIHTGLAILIVLLSEWCCNNNFGLVYWFNAGVLMTIVIGVLALDFSSWLVHFVMHKSRVLWRVSFIYLTANTVGV